MGNQPTVADKENETPDVLVVTPETTEPVNQEPEQEDGRTEPADESEVEPSEPHTSSTHSEIECPRSGSDTAADSLGARAWTRMAEALLESPPRIAYTVQVSRLLDSLEIHIASQPPVVLFEAALLSDRLCLPDGNLANSLRQVF